MDEDQVPLRQLQEELSELNSLVKHRGYQQLLLIAQRQVEARVNQVVYVPLKNSSSVYEQEFKKGEIAGIELFVKMTGIQIEDLEMQIEQLLTELETQNADSKS